MTACFQQRDVGDAVSHNLVTKDWRRNCSPLSRHAIGRTRLSSYHSYPRDRRCHEDALAPRNAGFFKVLKRSRKSPLHSSVNLKVPGKLANGNGRKHSEWMNTTLPFFSNKTLAPTLIWSSTSLCSWTCRRTLRNCDIPQSGPVRHCRPWSPTRPGTAENARTVFSIDHRQWSSCSQDEMATPSYNQTWSELTQVTLSYSWTCSELLSNLLRVALSYSKLLSNLLGVTRSYSRACSELPRVTPELAPSYSKSPLLNLLRVAPSYFWGKMLALWHMHRENYFPTTVLVLTVLNDFVICNPFCDNGQWKRGEELPQRPYCNTSVFLWTILYEALNFDCKPLFTCLSSVRFRNWLMLIKHLFMLVIFFIFFHVLRSPIWTVLRRNFWVVLTSTFKQTNFNLHNQ